jgi:hypothetical protein
VLCGHRFAESSDSKPRGRSIAVQTEGKMAPYPDGSLWMEAPGPRSQYFQQHSAALAAVNADGDNSSVGFQSVQSGYVLACSQHCYRVYRGAGLIGGHCRGRSATRTALENWLIHSALCFIPSACSGIRHAGHDPAVRHRHLGPLQVHGTSTHTVPYSGHDSKRCDVVRTAHCLGAPVARTGPVL